MAELSMTDKLKEFVAEALDRHSQGDAVEWDIGSGMAPNNQLIHFLTLCVPSPVLNETIMAGGVIGGANSIDAEKIDAMVQQALEQIRTARSQKLNAEIAHVDTAAKASPGGVLLP